LLGETTVARTQTIYEKGQVVFPRRKELSSMVCCVGPASTLFNERREIRATSYSYRRSIGGNR